MQALLEWFRNGGPIMWPILLVALTGIAVFLERFYVIIVRSRINGPAFIERVMQLVRAQKTEDAMRLCAQSHAPLPDIGLLILRSKSREEGDLQNVADAASLSVIPRLTRRLQYLPILANVATLIGLFGTIFGLQGRLRVGVRGVRRPALGSTSSGHRHRAECDGVRARDRDSADRSATPISHPRPKRSFEQVDEFSVRLINALVERPDVRIGR